MVRLHGYTLAHLANMMFDISAPDELKKVYLERTKKHIGLVNKYAAKIGKSYPNHDASKLSTLLEAYCFFSKPKEERTKEEDAVLDIATYIHITQAPHHPEYWTDTDLSGFTRQNPNPNGIIDARDMPVEYLEEMCADWCSCSEEFGTNTPFEWYQQVNGVRWLFSPEQQSFILETLRKMWE